MNKRCSKCNLEKDIEEFAKKLNGKASICKGCYRNYAKQHYKENRQRYLERNIFYQANLAKDVAEFISKEKSKPCLDCGNEYPSYVMDFDHRNPDSKKSCVAHMLRGKYSIKQIQKEIDKCDLVCANCHRIRTYSKFL
jgi:hypothetical protein